MRHSNKQIYAYEQFRNNYHRFEKYQNFQRLNAFHDAERVAVFVSFSGWQSLFLGIWNIEDHITTLDFNDEHHRFINEFNFPDSWHTDFKSYYSLRRDGLMSDLSERLVISWKGKAFIQEIGKQEVLQILQNC